MRIMRLCPSAHSQLWRAHWISKGDAPQELLLNVVSSQASSWRNATRFACPFICCSQENGVNEFKLRTDGRKELRIPRSSSESDLQVELLVHEFLMRVNP